MRLFVLDTNGLSLGQYAGRADSDARRPST